MLDIEGGRRLFGLLRERFAQEQENLNALDSIVGDGDHGYTMARAFQAAETATLKAPGQDLGRLLETASQALAESSGGAIGPLLAAFLAEGGRCFAGRQTTGTREWTDFLASGLQAIQEVGDARPGDKTLLDALAPAIRSMSESPSLSLASALEAAALAAERGAEATREMTAARGRARFLGERSRGHVDPGARSMAILIGAMHAAAQGLAAGPEPGMTLASSPPRGKLINDPETIVQQDNEGLSLAYPELVSLTTDGILVRAARKPRGKVGLAIGHGGGHTPSMGGLVGPGLLDADVYGPVFTCASGLRIARAIEHAECGGGVVLLVSNHSGDVLNARLALRRARQMGIRVEPVWLGDDIATAPRQQLAERRGLGGLLFTLKIGGAAAEAGEPLDKVLLVMQKTNERTATLSVAVRPPTHPASGKPLFEIPDGQMEIGTGVHGEVGVYRGPLLTADAIVDIMIARLTDDLKSFQPSSLLVFVNGAGGTSRTELHIVFRRAWHLLAGLGLTPHASVVESLFTTQEMGGFSLSLCALDAELASYWDAPASAACFRWPYR